MKRGTYLMPFSTHDELKKLGVLHTRYNHLYYLSPDSKYSADEVLAELYKDNALMKRVYNINVLNIDCPEILNYIFNFSNNDEIYNKIRKSKIQTWYII